MIDVVDKYYQFSTSCSLKIHEVFDEEVNKFSRALNRMQQLLRDFDLEEAWRDQMSGLKQYRFLISSCPLPSNHPLLHGQDVNLSLNVFTQLLANSAPPDVAACLPLVSQALAPLVTSLVNPLTAKFLELTQSRDPQEKTALVLLSNDLIPPAWEHLRSHLQGRRVQILSPYDLRNGALFERICLLGSPKWFEGRGKGFLFYAPRSPLIEVIAYSWINNSLGRPPSFDYKQPPFSGKSKRGLVVNSVPDPKAQAHSDREDPEAILPILDIDSLTHRLHSSGSINHDEHDDIVRALVVVLSAKNAVFLDADEKASSFVINLSAAATTHPDNGDNGAATASAGEEEEEEEEDIQDADNLLGRCHNNSLEEGMFLLLRTAGGGDLIVPLADRLLGPNKDSHRAMQKHWKLLLHAKFALLGPGELLDQVSLSGGTMVSEATVRNWMRERNIRPEAKQNFEAVLKLVGLGAETEAYWQNAREILRAHRRAGIAIRKLLLKQIKKADLQKLATQGSMVFELGGIEGGASMTAFRIENILPQTHEVNYTQLGHAIEIGDDLWR
jgi:hypothetical protein